jgi:hypothetical protein
MNEERRAPVQGDGLYRLRPDDPRTKGSHVPGTVEWSEHEEAWKDYHKRHPDQSAEVIAERGGFGYNEMTTHLGHEPRTWKPRNPK